MNPISEKPDDSETVILLTSDPDQAVWPGWWDSANDCWRYADATIADERELLGWLPMDKAATILTGSILD